MLLVPPSRVQASRQTRLRHPVGLQETARYPTQPIPPRTATVTSRGAIRWPRPWAPPLQVRDRANALMGSRVVRRRQESGSIFMTSPEVTIDEDNSEGRPITMYSWNIGAGGISGALNTLAEWIDVHSPTVVLLQECRITKRTVKKIRKSMLTLMPDYRAYFHCKAWESASDRPPAVITLVRHEIAMSASH